MAHWLEGAGLLMMRLGISQAVKRWDFALSLNVLG
jgi:hypothetical protein